MWDCYIKIFAINLIISELYIYMCIIEVYNCRNFKNVKSFYKK